jgi:ABC-2 type transport system permease protein
MRITARLTWIELKLLAREPVNAVFTLGFPLVVLLVLGGVFGNTPTTRDDGGVAWRGVGPMDYYMAAYIGLVMASLGLVALPVHIASYRELGVLRRIRASSMSARDLFSSQILAGFATTVVSSAILVLASLAVYQVHLPKSYLQLGLAFALDMLAFGAIGVLLGGLMPTARAAQAGGLLLYFVMMFVSGAGPPRDVISGPLQRVGDILPLTYVIRLMQNPWLGFGWDYTALAVVLVSGCAAAALSVRLFRWE